MSKSVLQWLAGSAISLAITGMAGAAGMIGINFSNGDALNQTPLSSDVVGPNALAGWNNTFNLNDPPRYFTYNQYNPSDHGSPVTLKDGTGANTTATFGFNDFGLSTLNSGATYSPGGPYGYGSANAGLTANQQLFNGAAHADSGGWTQQVTINNIPYATYDVYVLVVAVTGNNFYPNEGRGAVKLWNGNTGSGTTNPSPSTEIGTYYLASANDQNMPSADFQWVQATATTFDTSTVGANYVLFSGVTAQNITLDVFSPAWATNNGVYFGGIEIVESAPAPEPASAGLLLTGLSGLLVRRRRAA